MSGIPAGWKEASDRTHGGGMLSITSGINRRELLRLGTLSTIGLTTQGLRQLRAGSAEEPLANACVFLFLFGGPSHIDLWDMKPSAPAEIRGEFRPIDTNAAGIQICEHLPRLARQMDKLCLVRSMTHHMPVHGPACSEIYTGRPYFGPPVTDEARPEDWPSLSALVARYGRSAGPLPPSVIIPWYTQFAGQSKKIAGQTGGRMGDEYRGMLVEGDPSLPAFRLTGLDPRDGMSLERLKEQRELLDRLQAMSDSIRETDPPVGALGRHCRQAFSILEDQRVARAFDLATEPARTRDLYGRTKFGQSLLLARRLVEVGVSLVTVNWDDETREDKVSPFWDTHHDNFPKLKDHLCPVFDQGLASFLQDMSERGLLQRTLVVATGEFGRTPKIGQIVQNGMTERTGRDHWPHAFTSLLAGGGVRGGQVCGATTSTGSYVQEKPVSPADLSATILKHLGVDPSRRYFDQFQRISQRLSIGEPLRDLS